LGNVTLGLQLPVTFPNFGKTIFSNDLSASQYLYDVCGRHRQPFVYSTNAAVLLLTLNTNSSNHTGKVCYTDSRTRYYEQKLTVTGK